ncbi:unnamed protein product [Calicophoron daubneyi]|uniref:Exocyst complex component 2 n=1 Tax=Calicophoron daubneyi TaxID=300641 RepID=A0AAV2TKN7_CALDB
MLQTEGPAPHVDGISPNEGTPGTKLTIRGENLGTTASDLTHVFINQIDVGPTAQWFSPKKITAITPMGEGELEIVVVTKSGKFGTAAVSYHQYAQRNVGPQTPVTYWPEDERRHCPAIYEHGSESRSGEGTGAARTATGIPGGIELDPSTGLPMSEITRMNIPLSDSALRQLYSGSGSVQLTDKEFDPIMFLLKFYKSSSFNDLTVTFNNFRQSMRMEGAGEPINVIRTNLVLIFRCLEGMDSLRRELVPEKGNGPDGKNRFETPLESILSESRDSAYQLFEGVLKRRDRAESTRNAIGVMQRYQFLFNLPHAIRSNISKGDYSLVLNDYLRAKSLFANSEVEVLRRIYADVENVVANFRTILRNQLTTMPIECDEAKRKIGYLTQLEVNYDPTWLCLVRFKEWLIDRIQLYQNVYHQAIGNKNPNPSAQSTDRASSVSGDAQGAGSPSWFGEGVMSGTPPLLVLVKSVCRFLTHHVVQFWRLGLAYISGQLSNPSQMDGHSGSEFDNDMSKRIRNADDQSSDSEFPSTPPDPKAAWLQMNLELVLMLASRIKDEILEVIGSGVNDEVITEWLVQCIREFRRCYAVLPLNEISPEVVEMFSRLIHELRRHAVRGIFRRAQIMIEALQLKETWRVTLTDAEGGRTKLPLLYEDIMTDALSRCQEQVACHSTTEKPLFVSAELQERFPDWCGDAMVAFISTLRRLADQIESTISHSELQDEGNSRSDWLNVDSLFGRQSGQTPIVSQARGLLLVLNNAIWIEQHANKRLIMAYKAAGYASPERLQARLDDTWQKGREDLLCRYVRLRSSWLCAPIRPQLNEMFAMKSSFADDDDLSSITGLHTSVCAAISNLSHVFSELILLLGKETVGNLESDSNEQMVSPQSVLARVVSQTVDQLKNYYVELHLRSLPRLAQIQLILDFRALKAILPKGLFTPEASRQLDALSAMTVQDSSSPPGLQPNEERYLNKIIEQEKGRMRLLVDGFQSFDSSPSRITLVHE